MKQLLTKGIILARTDYGEADRILTLLTPDYGKLRLMAKGVRRLKSKMAGGIELFSTSDITFIQGRGDMGTLISTRLIKHYRTIVQDIDRTLLGYELIKWLNKVTEDEPEPEYFHLLEQAFGALDDIHIDTTLIRTWFGAQLLRLGGFSPNLRTDMSGEKLQPDAAYDFGFEETSLTLNPNGHFKVDNIKFLRLLFSGNDPKVLVQVQGSDQLVAGTAPLVQAMTRQHLRVF